MTKWGIITLTRLDPLILVELPRFKIASELKKKSHQKISLYFPRENKWEKFYPSILK